MNDVKTPCLSSAPDPFAANSCNDRVNNLCGCWYPVLGTVQSALLFTSLTDLLWEASSQMLQLMRAGCSYTYQPRSIARYSFIQVSELEQCKMKKPAQGFNTAAQDSNPGSHSRQSEALPLSHCALHNFLQIIVMMLINYYCSIYN